MKRRPGRSAIALLATASLLFTTGPVTAEEPAWESVGEIDESTLVRLAIPGRDTLDAVVDSGFDLAGNFAQVPEGYEVDAVVNEAEVAALETMGVDVRSTDERFNWADVETTVDPAQLPTAAQIAAAGDTIRLLRADWFVTKGQGFLSVEARSLSGTTSGPTMTLSWDSGPGTPAGSGGSATMTRFVDTDASPDFYMHHELLVPVDSPRPEQIRVVSSLGGETTGFVSDWLYPVEPLTSRKDYRWNFIDSDDPYRHPTEVFNRIDQLAAENPDIAEIVDLPFSTNGYRRKAQANMWGGNPGASVTGGGANTGRTVVVTSLAWGHEGGNSLRIRFLNPGVAGSSLGVSVTGNDISVSLGTSGAGALASTAAQVVAALNGTPASAALVRAHTYRGSAGTGIVQAQDFTPLSDFLDAPPEISREPFETRAIRIGRHRDGSKTGVLIANHATDVETRKIVDNVDIWIIPSNNPDGSHYSSFDFNFQRRNMTNHCADNNADPGRRDAWGVDLNRNYRYGSGFDGYSGASTSCTSDTYQGPSELSEPETQNVIWIADTNPNLKFFMTIHSNGGQLFWQPGAYIAAGRVTTPRPEMRDETYYWQMAERILSHVYQYQETVVHPTSVGGSSDVLYSSAGNVREDLYFNYGIYALGWEIGGNTWDPVRERWDPGAFQPPIARAHGEAMEYANGVMEMFRIAADWGKDFQWPTSKLVRGAKLADGGVEVAFLSDEPATVYYTTDGSRPTLQSTRYQFAGVRDKPETLVVTEATTFHWFSVDPAGNIEQNYDPGQHAENFRKATVNP
jgi:hypothetical protein